jgi:AraC-like DNA-binding protein
MAHVLPLLMPERSTDPVLYFIDARDRHGMPDGIISALEGMEVITDSREGSTLTIRASWIDAWWFTLIEGNGIVQFRNRPATLQDDDLLLVFALSGRSRTDAGGLNSWPAPGEMVLTQWEAPTHIVTVDEFRYLVAHIPRSELEAAFRNEGIAIPYGDRFPTLIGPGAVLYSTIRSLAGEAMRRPVSQPLKNFVGAVPGLIVQAFRARVEGEVSAKDNRLARIIHFLESHLADPTLSSDLVGRACGVSQRQLFRILAENGTTLTKMLNLMRIGRARELLLRYPSLCIAEIARTCGFSSGSYFSRIFRHTVGTSPLRYRRNGLT